MCVSLAKFPLFRGRNVDDKNYQRAAKKTRDFRGPNRRVGLDGDAGIPADPWAGGPFFGRRGRVPQIIIDILLFYEKNK